jgi:hypothetical protein
MANEFQYRGQLNGGQNPVTLKILIANSQTVVKGRAVKMQALGSGGGCLPATAGSRIVGFVAGIVDSNGIDLDNTKQTLDGTWSSANQSYAAAADNMTVKKIAALVVVDKNALWYNDTAGDLVVADEYKFFDLSTAAQVADQNGHDTAGALVLVKRDPDGDADASKGIFMIAESSLDPYAQV